MDMLLEIYVLAAVMVRYTKEKTVSFYNLQAMLL